MTRRLTPPHAESTACANLVILPGQPHAPLLNGAGLSQFALVHHPSGQRVATADEPAALHHLAQQLAWFDTTATDPRYLDDPHNVDICESLRELLRHWCAAESDYDPHATLLACADYRRRRCQSHTR